MNFKSLKFLHSFKNTNRQFAVIGLGRFGRAVSETLHKLGCEVLATDINEKLVNQAITDRIVSHCIQLDSTEPSALKEAGIFEFDTVIVAIGNYVQESIITTLSVKEGGVPYVVAKSSSEIHGRLLEKVGADLVVYPEYDAGKSLAQSLTKPGILDRFELDDRHSIVEVIIPDHFHGRNLAELELRKHYGLNVLAIGQDEQFEINPPPERRLSKGVAMVVIGANEDIQKLPI